MRAKKECEQNNIAIDRVLHFPFLAYSLTRCKVVHYNYIIYKVTAQKSKYMHRWKISMLQQHFKFHLMLSGVFSFGHFFLLGMPLLHFTYSNWYMKEFNRSNNIITYTNSITINARNYTKLF